MRQTSGKGRSSSEKIVKGNKRATRKQYSAEEKIRIVLASSLDGLLYGSGDSVVGINPATDSLFMLDTLLIYFDDMSEQIEILMLHYVLSHVTLQIKARLSTRDKERY